MFAFNNKFVIGLIFLVIAFSLWCFSNNKFVIGLIFLVIAFSLWYFFIKTLMLSDLIGKDVGPMVSILINLFDFDIGLTRYDIHHLKSKGPYWVRRLQEVDSITDSGIRDEEVEELIAEMMKDPSLKKVIKKASSFGIDAVSAILMAI